MLGGAGFATSSPCDAKGATRAASGKFVGTGQMNYASREEPGLRFKGQERLRTHEFEGIWDNELHAVFSDVAPYYDRASNFASLGLYARWRDRFVSLVDLQCGQQVLDVCAGTNAIGLSLLRREPGLQVCAMDRSAAMQAVGRGLAQSLDCQVGSVIGDAHALPFPDDSFDIVTQGWASRHLRVMEVFSEIRRVLKPGGRFYHCDMLRPKNRVVEGLYCAYLKACVSATALIFRSGPEARDCRKYFVRAIQRFYSAEELSELLGHVGFSEVQCEQATGGMVAFHQARKT
jgi:demethylmenaquinone methyltransferase/2-methoxy-6-polyprenyl-1,4-benzoquinol methylase